VRQIAWSTASLLIAARYIINDCVRPRCFKDYSWVVVVLLVLCAGCCYYWYQKKFIWRGSAEDLNDRYRYLPRDAQCIARSCDRMSSLCPSVCDVDGSGSHRLEIL